MPKTKKGLKYTEKQAANLILAVLPPKQRAKLVCPVAKRAADKLIKKHKLKKK